MKDVDSHFLVSQAAHEEMMRKYASDDASFRRAYKRLNRKINTGFKTKKLIGDIACTDDEFEILRKYAFLFLQKGFIYSWQDSLDQHLCVFLVQVGIRYYNGRFWPHVERLLGGKKSVWSNYQAFFGQVCYSTLRAYGKSVLSESERVDTILMHGFVSERYFTNLMDFLYSYYRIDLNRNLENNNREMMRGLVQAIKDKSVTNSSRTYKLVRQISDAVNAHPKGCTTRLRWLLKQLDAYFWDDNAYISATNRFQKPFFKWVDENLDFENSRKTRGTRQKQYSSPHFVFNLNIKKFYLQVPSQVVRSDHMVEWSLKIREREESQMVDSTESVLGYKTETLQIPISDTELFEKISLEMSYDEHHKHFSIPAEKIRFFTTDGFSVKKDNVKAGEYYVFSCEDLLTSSGMVEKRKSGALWFYHLYLSDGDYIREEAGRFQLIGERTQEGLLRSGMLTGVRSVQEELLVYNRIPSVNLQLPESRIAGTMVVLNGTRKRLKDIQKAVSPKGGLQTATAEIWLDLAELGCDKDGIYQLTVNVPNDRSERKWSFLLIKDLRYHFDDHAPYIFQPKGTIYIDGIPAENIAWRDDGIGKDSEEGFNFEIESDCRELEFKINGFWLQFRIPLFEYSFDRETWYTRQFNEMWYSDLPQVIWMRYPASSLELQMDSDGDNVGDHRLSFLKRAAEDDFQCDITKVRSWFRDDQGRYTLNLIVQEKSLPFLDIVTRSYVTTHGITSDADKNMIYAWFSIVGKGEFYVDIYYHGKQIIKEWKLEKHNDQIMKAAISCKIHNGNYTFEVLEKETEEEFGFDEESFRKIYQTTVNLKNPFDLTGSKVNLLGVHDSKMSFFVEKLCRDYVINNLRSYEEGEDKYIGFMTENGGHPVKVILELPEGRRDMAVLYWIDPDYNEEEPFLYDLYAKRLVCEEEKGLRSAERYRRYNWLDPDTCRISFKVMS